MNKLFSERQELVDLAQLKADDMPITLRNRIWNKTKLYFYSYPDRDLVIYNIWDSFLKQDTDTLKRKQLIDTTGEYLLKQIKDHFYDIEWYKVYDLLEFLLSFNNPEKDKFICKINAVLESERAPYKIMNDQVIPLISKLELKEVKNAIDSKYAAASNHISKALNLYSKKPIGDYHNSIKESIHSIEALARILLDDPSATLSKLAEQLNIHPAFRKAIIQLYGWTSDQSGIRHANKTESLEVNQEEARYMLVQCSALLNYIISKYST